MPVCGDCQGVNNASARFCQECGSPLTTVGGATLKHSAKEASVEHSLDSLVGGRYLINSFLGEGSTKKVYGVTDTILEREVALALIKTHRMDDVERTRILREAQVMAKLGDHPNIVHIFEFGEDAGTPFMVLPLMAGGALNNLISETKNGNRDLTAVVNIAMDVCNGLDFAHLNSVIHRDVKPGNVWLSRDGTAKIGDFGLAISPARDRITGPGIVVGTVAYMAPEQAVAGQIDERSDLYSLGAMMYELVTSHRPFTGNHALAVINQHVQTAPVPPSRYNPACTTKLEQLILQATRQGRHGQASISPGSNRSPRSHSADVSADAHGRCVVETSDEGSSRSL